MNVGLIVPTLNAGDLWNDWLLALRAQQGWAGATLVIDSSSKDATVDRAREAGLLVQVIARGEFNHGGTRQRGVELLPEAEILVFLTQDALLAGPDSIAALIRSFDNPSVGAAYGRQLPHKDAGPIGAHARVFNYPATSHTKSLGDRDRYGIKTAFISNSFAAYRRSALASVGGFPGNVIFGEDTYATAKMLMRGWSVAYCADACVHHSHDYSVKEDFRRSFDIGVFHAREPWLQQTFGKAEKEGLRYVRSELAYLAKRQPLLIVSALVRTGAKLLGYRLGKLEQSLPLSWKKRFSMSRTYWASGT